jgi:hypothetical protein
MFLFLPCDLTTAARHVSSSLTPPMNLKKMIVAMLFRVTLKLELAYFEIFYEGIFS